MSVITLFLSVNSLNWLLQLLHLFLWQTSTLYYEAQLCHFCRSLESPEGSWPKESISDYNVLISVIYGLLLCCINLRKMSKLLIPDTWSVQFAMLNVSIWNRIIVKKLMFENYLILGTRTHSQGKNMWLEKVVSLFLYINWFVVCTILKVLSS